MPIYEFICRSCSEQFDKLVPYDWRSAGVVCPDCGSAELDRAVSRIGGFQSGGKMDLMSSATACPTCTTGSCRTCN